MEVIQPFIGDEIPYKELLNIISNTVNFKINIKTIYENFFSLELFLGPTMAFKDIGVKFFSGCIKYLCKQIKTNIIILTATSGDTGAAVANAFNKIDGVKVVILYPSSKRSFLQEKQITTLGENRLALEIKGNFDDCQLLAKKAFYDEQIRNKLSEKILLNEKVKKLLKKTKQSIKLSNSYEKFKNLLLTSNLEKMTNPH